jgi:hypothetical protein
MGGYGRGGGSIGPDRLEVMDIHLGLPNQLASNGYGDAHTTQSQLKQTHRWHVSHTPGQSRTPPSGMNAVSVSDSLSYSARIMCNISSP